MKKYLLFLPIALYFYILHTLTIILDSDMQSLGIAVGIILTLFTAVTYILGLIRLVTSPDYNEKTAVRISMMVKIPQIFPIMILFGGGMLMLCFPMGFLFTIVTWIIIGFTHFATSITEAVACYKMWRAHRISLIKTIIFGALSFVPLIDYVVLVVIFIKSISKSQSVEGVI